MHFEAAPDNKNGILFLSGELTLLQAAELKGLLITSLASSECLAIDIEALVSIDLSCLQLLCSAHRSAANRGKPLTLLLQDSPAFAKNAAKAGLIQRQGCQNAGGRQCLWNVGGAR